MQISFEHLPLGAYTEEMLATQWPGVSQSRGVAEGRCSIEEIDTEHVLCVTLQKDKVGPVDGGVSWRYFFDTPADSYTAEYNVRIEDDFAFMRGGKLPGLCGGSSPGGGADTSKADGFSARGMWREHGVLETYLYSTDRPSDKNWGCDYLWFNSCNTGELFDEWNTLTTKESDRVYLEPGQWHTIKQIITLNTPGLQDGQVVILFDDVEVLNMSAHFRDDKSFFVDSFRFATFFGGNDPSWAPAKDEKIYFKDFNFSTHF